MTDAEYEFECSRAELLGIAPPSKEEFLARRRETENALEGENDELRTDDIEVL